MFAFFNFFLILLLITISVELIIFLSPFAYDSYTELKNKIANKETNHFE